MNMLEKEFLQSIKEVDQLTPKDVFLVENETLPPDCVQYCINLNDKQFHIIIMKNSNEVLMLAKEDGNVLKNLKNGELVYQELKRKARIWYKGVDFSKHTVMFNNQECRVILDVFSFIQPFVLKSVNDSSLKYIGLDFLTVFSLINKHEV
ncbi:MAG: hypothetical protein RR959_06060 [Erysipelotrichaceae bacterium]